MIDWKVLGVRPIGYLLAGQQQVQSMQKGLVTHKLIAVTCRSMQRSKLGVGFIGRHLEGMSVDDKLAVSQAAVVAPNMYLSSWIQMLLQASVQGQ